MLKTDLKIRARKNCLLFSLVFFASSLGIPAHCAQGVDHVMPETSTYYVSKKGSNGDGKSWKNAWNELDQINWKEVMLGNASRIRIVIDGGPRNMTYRKALRASYPVLSFPGKTIEITRSRDPEHSGQIIIDGNNQIDQAVVLALPNTRLNGLGWRGILIRGFRRVGVRILSDSVSLNGVEVAGYTAAAVGPAGTTEGNPPNPPIQFRPSFGVHASGYGAVKLSGVIVHDTMQSMRVRGPLQASLSKCWFYNSSYMFNPEQQNKVSGLVSGYDNEIIIDDPPVEPQDQGGSTMHAASSSLIRNSIIGPGLGRGLVSVQSSNLHASDCLLINASSANLVRNSRPGSASGGLSATRITSFMTTLNPQGNSHDCLRANQANMKVRDSIVFGGHVRVPAELRLGAGNFQYLTTGNTAALSKTQINPLFKADLETYTADTAIAKLARTNYSLKQGSPANGKGSGLSSLNQLLNSPLP